MKSQINNDIFSESGCQGRDSLLRYIEGKLSDVEKHAVEEHLIDCPLCNDALEGLKHTSKINAMDDINASIHEMVKGGGVSFSGKYFLAAASMAAVILLSYFAFKQFNEVKDEKFAVHETILPEETPLKKNESTLTAETLSVVPVFPKQATESSASGSLERIADNYEVAEADVKEFENPYVETEESATGTTLHSVPQNVVMQSDDKFFQTEIVVKSPTASNNITYIDNLKVIEYPDPGIVDTKDAIQKTHTPSAYQNREKKMEAAKAEQLQGISTKRNSNYQEMVTDPLILYNKGRYESAIQGFDRLLEINPNDYNALFYKGMSLYHLKKFNTAISHFKKIGDDTDNPFSEEALFYMAKSYAGKGDTFNAVSNFNRVVYTNGFYSGKAADEIDKLK